MQVGVMFSFGNLLKPEENSSSVRNPFPSESSESKTFSSSSELRGSSPFSLCQKTQKTIRLTKSKDTNVTVTITTGMRVFYVEQQLLVKEKDAHFHPLISVNQIVLTRLNVTNQTS